MRTFFLLIIYFYSAYCANAQVSVVDARRIENTLYNVLDKNVGQMFSFAKVTTYLDGSKMDKSKCDNIIYLEYKDEYFKRSHEGGLNIRWFGCNETRLDNQLIINQVLARYKTAYIPAGIFKFSGTITVPENAQLFGAGYTSQLQLISKSPVNAISLFRRGSLEQFKLDCSASDMDLSAGILVNSWADVQSRTGESRVQHVQIVGNYPQLQGVGIKLEVTRAGSEDYSVIAFCKFLDIDIYGFRDGIFCDVQYRKGKNISYINANIFENIILHRCLRPLRLVNMAENADIVSGKSAIASNYFRNLVIQHVVGNYPAIFVDGGIFNDISAHVIDWTGNHVESTTTSSNNSFQILPSVQARIKLNSPTK
ncbi:MAG: hypothetical protein V4725_15570 [Bacteroidota bacterium]